MSATADTEPVAGSEEDDIFGPPENYPVLSSSESWHGSEDPSSESDDEEDIKDASQNAQIKIEDEGSQSDSGLEKSEQKHPSTNLRLQLERGTHRSSIQAYKALLKDMHVDPDSKTWNKQQNVTLSTVGLVQWSGKENDTFFRALARKGKGNVGEIAQQIGSKSRLEVADYIEFLEERLQRHQSLELSLLEAHAPAAVEINGDLEEILDHLAENVALEDQKKDLLEAEKDYGSTEYWILDRAKANKVEELLVSTDEDALPEAISPSAGLLHLKNWIRLSEKVFMNPGRSRPEDSWKNVAQRGQTPSLTADALGALYDLTVDLVVRLMEEAHNTALERLDKERRHRKPFVRKKDVRRALTTMGMKHNTFDYYVNLPRRLKIDVVEWKRTGTAKSYVSYDKVEKMLSRKRQRELKESPDSSDSSSEDTGNDENSVAEGAKEEEEQEDDGDVTDDDLDGFGSSEHESESQSQDDQEEPEEEEEGVYSGDEAEEQNNIPVPKSKPIDDPDHEDMHKSEYTQLEYEKRLDDYDAYLDRQASHKEEARIRELLGFSALDDKEEQKPPTITEDVRREIMHNNVVVDWRKDLVYQDEWETYGMGTRDVEKDIAANRNKRRRLQ